MCNHHFRIENLDIRIALNISCGYNTLALKINVSNFRFLRIAVVLDCETLDIHDDFRHIFFYTRDGAEFVKYTINLYLTYSSSR